jgi:predicted nuclease of predicted toxin-antitoxin system
MKLLVDANLSWRLTKILENEFAGIKHVEQTDLPIPATDIQIWDFARSNGYIILTNDEDFLNLLLQKGSDPPYR